MTQSKHNSFETWIWLELLGFNNLIPDYGVEKYLDNTGFVPDSVSLLLTAIDFIFLNDQIDEDKVLPPDMCSRNGHEKNYEKARQEWTKHQIKGLIAELKRHEIDVYLSVFPHFIDNRFHHEWASDHPEIHSVYTTGVVSGGINVLKRFSNGDYFEDFFIEKLVKTIDDYGFTGWQGCDGFGPLSGGLNIVEFSDDMVDQFTSHQQVELDESVTGTFHHDMDNIRKRADWILQHKRREWIEFYTDRWAGFWKKAVDSLHRQQKKAIINSSWGRAPFESIYRYGVDYKKIFDTGVDGMLVETVAVALGIDSRPNCSDMVRHYDFLAMLMLIKAYVPDMKLLFLQNTQDVVEDWDVLRHVPMALEKAIYSLSNVFHIDNSKGKLERCVDGPLICLGDGIQKYEWDWIRSRLGLSFSSLPVDTIGATLVWSNELVDNQLGKYLTSKNWSTHRLLYHLMSQGAPIQKTININYLDLCKGPIVVLNSHLLSERTIEQIFAYTNGPIILIGENSGQKEVQPTFQLEDPLTSNNISCHVYQCDKFDGVGAETLEDCPVLTPSQNLTEALQCDHDKTEILEDLPPEYEPAGYWDNLYYQPVSKFFIASCAEILIKASDFPEIVNEHKDEVTLMVDEYDDGPLRLAIKSNVNVYSHPKIDFKQEITDSEICSLFPRKDPIIDGTCITTTVPPKGIAVLKVNVLKS